MRLIPAIDLQAGRCVRLLHGKFDHETRYPVEAGALLAKYRELGADWLHVVDLDGARDGRLGNHGIIRELAQDGSVELQAGGGLRDAAAVSQMLDCGVSRIVVGSAAVSQVAAVRTWLQRFGPQRVVLAFDVRINEHGAPQVATHGWQRQSPLSLWDAVGAYEDSGLRHVLCTDIDRDGALTGPNVSLYAQAAKRFPQLEWQASGGVRSAADLHALADAGAAAAISGRALLEQLISREELQPFLPSA